MLKLSTAFAIVLLLFSFTGAQAKVHKADQSKKISASKQISSKKKVSRSSASKKTAKSTVATKKSGKKKSIKTTSLASKKSKKKSKQLVAVASKKPAVARSAVIPQKSMGDLSGLQEIQDPLALKSNVALVVDQESSQVLFEKNADVSLPIASITKLMTSLVVLEAGQDMDELLEITSDDIDTEKNSGSRLRVGTKLSRADMLHIALMSSENRAASSLGRYYPGGLKACVAAMNAKARALGMKETFYVDTTGLSSRNVASAQDLVKLVKAAYQQPLIREYSTDTNYAVSPGGRTLEYTSSNRLTSKSDWEIGLQKTGYISEAGRCLVMQAMIKGRSVVMVFLDSKGKYSRFADAGRIRKWLEKFNPSPRQVTF